MNNKLILTVIFFLPLLAIALINPTAMESGAYPSKLATCVIFAIAGLLSAYAIWIKKLDANQLILALLVIWAFGLSLPTLF